MSLVRVGTLSLGVVLPMVQDAKAQLDGAVGVSLPGVQAQVAGALRLQAQIAIHPPDYASVLAAAEQLLDSVKNLLAQGLSPPVIDIGAQLAALQLQLTGLQANAAFSVVLGGLLGTPGIHLYRWDGPIGSLAGEVGAQMGSGLPGGGGPNQLTSGVMLLAADNGAAAAIVQMFA